MKEKKTKADTAAYEEKVAEIKRSLRKVLDHKRYQHTIGVAYTAVSLAMRYRADLRQAELAGLLHDCAKFGTKKKSESEFYAKQLEKCEKYHIELSEVERRNPALIHAKLGAYLAAHKYGVTDPEVLSAIRKHTTGTPDMTMLEKIVFLADSIEPGRKPFAYLTEIRYAAFTDIDEAVYMVTKNTLDYLKTKRGAIDPITVRTYEYYERLHWRKQNQKREPLDALDAKAAPKAKGQS